MRFDPCTTFYRSSNRFDLEIRNRGRLASTGHQPKYPRRSYDLEPALKPAFEKYVTREQRQRECFAPVLPIVGGCVERQERLKPFAGENLGHHFFMLVACVDRIPGKLAGLALT